AVSPKFLLLSIQTAVACFFFLRQPTRPSAPKPVANNGNAPGSGTDVGLTKLNPEISMAAGAPKLSPYTNWKGKVPLDPVYVPEVKTNEVPNGALITVSLPMVSVSPSSCPAWKPWPVVTVTLPVKLNNVLFNVWPSSPLPVRTVTVEPGTLVISEFRNSPIV